MAAHPLYSSCYTWGFSVTMFSCCLVFQEASSYWRRQLPSLAPDIDYFLFLLYTICTPSLLGLVAFQYKHDISLISGSFWESICNQDFLLWFMHALCTSVFFLGCCVMAFIYSR